MGRTSLSFLVILTLGLGAGRAYAQAAKDDDLLEDLGPAATPAPVEETVAPPEEVKATSVEKPEAKAATPPPSETATSDRIKAVPRKPVLKNGRLELLGGASLSLNDAYYQHFAFNGAAIFYPHDAFGIGVGVDYIYANARSSNIDVVRQTQTSVPAVFEAPKLFAHVDLYWVPIYGKVSLFDSSIVHFEFYGVAGAGVVSALGSRRPPEANVGLGQRFFLGDWLALRFEVRDHMFVDTLDVNQETRSDIQNYVLFVAGVSFFIPPSFEYSYR